MLSIRTRLANNGRRALLRHHDGARIIQTAASPQSRWMSVSRPLAVATASATSPVQPASASGLLNRSRASDEQSARVGGVGSIGALAAALVAAAAWAATSADLRAEERRSPPQSPSPSWLGDRLTEAAAAGDLSRLQQLFDAHHPVEGVNITHRFGWTPLHAAVANGHADVVRWLLAQPGVEVNKIDRYVPRARNLDQMVIKHSARQAAFPEIYPSLPADGLAALHYAALLAPIEILDELIAAGADLDAEAHGFTADKLVDFSQVSDDTGGAGGAADRSSLAARKARHEEVTARLSAARQRRREERARKDKEERLRFPLELKLAKEMVAQELPILSVAAAVRRRENGWFDPDKPLVFLFLGSSGVGKTMLAKLLAKHVLKDDENGFIRIDMSEYQTKHELSKLIGSPPGYVGHEEGGQLTTKLAKCPNAVVLFDEVEKAHPDILTLMLQIFDEGRLTDGKGNTISCPNAIFCMTSNLVSSEIRDAIENGFELRPSVSILADLAKTTRRMRELGGITRTPLQPPLDEDEQRRMRKEQQGAAASPSPAAEPAEVAVPPTTTTILPGAVPMCPAESDSEAGGGSSGSSAASDAAARSVAKLAADTERFLRFIVHPLLKRAFHRDEFIGRINDLVIFHPFSQSDLEQTVTTELRRWAKRAKERHDIDLKWTPQLVESLTQNYDERYGYRSIIYGVEKRVVNVLASAHERDRIGAGCSVTLDLAEPTQPGQQPHVVLREITKRSDKEHAEGRKKLFGIF